MGPSAQELLTVRKRILGLLMRDAREASSYTVGACSELLGIPVESYERFESGDQTPTLPQLEILAYFFDIPLKHFFGTDTLASSKDDRNIKDRVPELTMLRQKVIGLKLRELREKSGYTMDQVSEKSGLSSGQIEVVENGMLALPVTALEGLAQAVNARIEDLVDSHGTVGNWLLAQDQFDSFTELPSDLRSFIVRPINRSYLDLAVRLSNMEVNELRKIAESILEITF